MEGVQSILSPWEIELSIQHLHTTDLEDVGTRKWFEFHKKLMLLNQQSVFEIQSFQEEEVKRWFINHEKVGSNYSSSLPLKIWEDEFDVISILFKVNVLIHEAVQIMMWKQNVLPIMMESFGEPSNTFLLYSVFYHEELAISILENVVYYCDSIDAMGDSIVDLIDYAVYYLTKLLYSQNQKKQKESKENESCWDELIEKRDQIEFDLGMRCISIIRYLSEFIKYLPLCALSRILSTNDVPCLFIQLIELKPWFKTTEKGERMIYEGKWQKVSPHEEDKLCKMEGQVWLGLRELLLDPQSGPYYDITEFRMSQLTRLQKYLNEDILDQIAPMIDLRRWLASLNVSSQAPTTQRPINVEVIPDISTSISAKYSKRWKRLAEHQAKTLFTKDAEHIRSMAEILSEAYDFDKIDIIDSKKCLLCKGVAKHRCSRCKEAWYCGRECQVKNWSHHKTICDNMVELQAGTD